MRAVGLTVRAILLASAASAAGVAYADETTGPANGQTTSAEQPPALLEEIVVTSSRAALPGFSASTPTTVVGSDVVEREDAANISQVLNEIPGFKQTQSPSANGVKTGTPGTFTADLRGLGAQRTLVLIDGLRAPPTAPATNTSIVDAVDMNNIPTFMVDRVEVVTGGASAQWGSDAVAGVINIRLKDKFEGFQAKLQGGISQRADDANGYAAFLGGTSLFNDRGHFVAGIEFQDDSGLGDIYNRPWSRNEAGIVANSAYATNGLPANIEADHIRTSLSTGGYITSGAYKGNTFNPDGSIRPFQVGSLTSGTQMIGGEGQSLLAGFDMVPATRRVASYSKTSYDISDNVTASFVLSYAWNSVLFHGSSPRITARTISADNVFAPAPLKGTAFGFQENAVDLGNSHLVITNNVPRAVFALNGKIGDSTWTWDAGAEWGADYYHQVIGSATDTANLAYALDAVAGPDGQPICRGVLNGVAAAAGCQPLNLFGQGNASKAAIAYVQQQAGSDSHYYQEDANANIKGEPFSTWAGPVAAAFGVEYRNESQEVTATPLSASNAFLVSGNATPFTGSFNVKEGYVDTIVPLAKDVMLAKSLSFNGAARYEHYSDIGNQHTWKVGLDWQPVDAFRLRATHSVDIRAPQLFELYGGGTLLTNSATYKGKSYTIPQNVTEGNPHLLPETAKTNTYGFVIAPHAGPLAGLSLALDYYDIKIDQAIVSLSAANIAGLCNAGNQAFCNFFTLAPDGVTPTGLFAGTFNLASEQSKGIDLNLAYQTSIPSLFNQPTSLQTTLIGNRTLHSLINTGSGVAIDRAGEQGPQNLGAVPHLTLNMTETLVMGPTRFSAQGQFISRGNIDNTFNTSLATSINNNSIGSMVYLNLYAGYELNDHFEFSASIHNALDRAPPLSPYPNLPDPQYNGQFYDLIGRAFKIAVMYRM
jgi:iron complex outermembrane recepter protein